MLIFCFHDTQQTRDPNFGGSVTWNFSVWSILMKWEPFFNSIMADADILFLSTLGKLETQTFGGVGHLKFFHMIDINEMTAIFIFFIMADTDIPFLSTLRKPDTQTLGGGVGNLKFFCMIDINEMAAIFQFFHNGQHWYSISIDTQKTRDPKFVGGWVIWNFSLRSILTKWQPFFNFFIMADTDILFPSTLGKLETWIFHQFSFPTFSVGSVFPITLPRFRFNINAWLHLKHFLHGNLSALRKLIETQILHRFSFPNFSVGSVFRTPKTRDTNFPSIQFCELFCWFSFPCHPS